MGLVDEDRQFIDAANVLRQGPGTDTHHFQAGAELAQRVAFHQVIEHQVESLGRKFLGDGSAQASSGPGDQGNTSSSGV